MTRHIERFSVALDAKDRTDVQCKDLRAQLAAKHTGLEDILSFCSTAVAMLAREFQQHCKQSEEVLRSVCGGEVDRSA